MPTVLISAPYMMDYLDRFEPAIADFMASIESTPL